MGKLNYFQQKRSNEQGKAPASGVLQPGELAVNYAAGSPGLYIEDDAGTVVLLADAGASAGGKVDRITGNAPIVVENGDSDAPNIKFNDAPNDGKQYARKSLGWAEVEIPDVPPATTVGTTAPSDPQTGQLWYADTTAAEGGGRLFVYTGNEWVDTSLPAAFETTFFKASEAEVLKLEVQRQNKRIAALEQSLVKLLG